jgi:hypothetical protein
MKEYSVPIRWESYCRITVQASNINEACTLALKEFLSISDDNYLDDSFSIDEFIVEENPNEAELYNEEEIYKKLWE